MKIKNLDFSENPLFLAPMAGVTDVGFRYLCSKFGADATVTEMLSARAMAHNPHKTGFLTLTSDAEKIKIAQIFGHEDDYLKKAVQNPILAKFDSFDINMGCPAPKIVKNGEGSALMDNLPLAEKIIKAVKSATDKPVSVKFRKGKSTENYVEFGRMCQEAGADFVTFHARTVAQGYSGRADYDAIANLKAKLDIPVVGNGDVFDKLSLDLIKKTGVDGVMIGRGAMGRPWMFAELKGQQAKIDRYEVVKKHVEILREHFDESWIKLYIRKHLLWYSKDLPLSSSLRLKLSTCENVDECLEMLKNAFEKSDEVFE